MRAETVAHDGIEPVNVLVPGQSEPLFEVLLLSKHPVGIDAVDMEGKREENDGGPERRPELERPGDVLRERAFVQAMEDDDGAVMPLPPGIVIPDERIPE
jgi:hypothetical protein